MKIAILFFPGLGNAILLMPALQAIKATFPKSDVHLLIRAPVVKELLENTGLVDQFLVYQRRSKILYRLITQLRLINKLRRNSYDLIISTAFHGDKESLLVLAARGERKVGYRAQRWHNLIFDEVVGFDPNMHEMQRHLRLVGSIIGGEPTNKLPEITLKQQHISFAEQTLSSCDGKLVIGIHPGCSDALAYKRWPVDRFAAVADHLARYYGAHIVLFGGPNEVSLSQRLDSAMFEAEPTILVGKTSILEAAASIQKCDLFISNDSGLMHVAASMQVPVVAIFGPTNPLKNAPLSLKSTVVRAEEACPITLNELCPGCKRCYVEEGRLPICLDRVTVSRVVHAAKQILNRSSPH